MPRKPLLLPLYALLACCFTFSAGTLGGSEDPPLQNAQPGRSEDPPLHNAQPHTLGPEARPVYSSLTAHEWGTFTSVAGSNGEAVATVVGEESASAKAPAKVKAKGKVPARKKKTRGAHK